MYTRLNKLGVCASHKTVLRLVQKLGKNHDQPVLLWKGALEGSDILCNEEDDVETTESISSADKGSIDSVFMEVQDSPNVESRPVQRYILTGDNIDKSVSPRYMTVDHQTKSLHYFHAYASLNRIDLTGVSEEMPTSRLLRNLETSAFLPSVSDCQALRDNYVVLFSRVICETLTAFSSFRECVPKHIAHKYSVEMAKKSVTVS